MALNRSEYYSSLLTYLPDNSNQLISPQDVRSVLIDLVESIPNFISDKELSTLNLGSEETRSTRVGDLALKNINNLNHYSEDNSAFGYYALAANYNGVRNTALGSYSLGCSLYGSDNVAVGFLSSAGALTGSGNVGIGNFTLQNNKYGNFNIAIGHGAGANINPNSDYKFFLGAYPTNSGSHCVSCPEESGFTHLMYGELDNIKLGIGVKTLHNLGTLQVSGTVSPWLDKDGNLGHPYRMWGAAYIASGLGYNADSDFVVSRVTKPAQDQYLLNRIATFSDNKVAFGNVAPLTEGFATIDGSVLPSQDMTHTIGHPDYRWNGIFGNIIVSGTAQFNVISWEEKTECLYNCKTLHLATSGICEDDIFNSTVCGFLSDEGLDGAGFEVHSSGNGYRRDYRFIYRFPDQTLSCLEQDNAYSRSKWESNTSIGITDGNHLQTQRVLSKNNLSLVSQSGCLGVFIRPNKIIFGAEPFLPSGSSEFNFLAGSGFTINNIAHGSGLTIRERFLSRNATRGFDLSYVDAQDVVVSGRPADRFVISSVDNNNIDILTILRSGAVGISNSGSNFIPQGIFNVSARSGCDTRFTSFNLGEVSLKMLAQSNIPISGFEILYQPKHPAKTAESPDNATDNTVLVDFCVLSPSGTVNVSGLREGAISIAENNFVGIGTTRIGSSRRFSPNAPLTVQHESSISGTVSLRAQSVAPALTANFGKFYVKPFAYSTQTHLAYFMDGAGNEYTISPTLHERYLYVDSRANTFGGTTPTTRPLPANVDFNTGFGHRALTSIAATSSGNVSVAAAENFLRGNSNVFIGRDTMTGVASGNRNVIVGANQFNSPNINPSGNVVIGFNNFNGATNQHIKSGNIIVGLSNLNNVAVPNNAILIGSGLSTNISDYTFNLGFDDAPVLIGSLGSSNRKIEVKNGAFSVWSALSRQALSIEHNQRDGRWASDLIIKDNVNPSINDGFFAIRFMDASNATRTLVDFDFKASGMSTTPNFSVPSPARPFVGVNGDIRLLGALRFSDGTHLDTATFTPGALLNFCPLPDALSIANDFDTATSYLAISVPSGVSCAVGKISLQSLSDFVGSGFAAVSNNCNHIWSNAEANVDKLNNASTVFIGCDVAIGATGWRNSVFIGTDAGRNSTTPNVGLATDTSCIFIGNQAGRDADNIANTIAVGTNAGYNAYNSSRSIYIGSNAGAEMHGNDNIGIGAHAVRGSGVSSVGARNIEIVAGLLDNQRLMYSSGNLSDALNIQNTIAGNTNAKKISVGHATLNPDAPFSVRRNTVAVPEHATNDMIQSWWCEGVKVAHIDCSGRFVGNMFVEGVSAGNITAPTSPSSPTTGTMTIKNSGWQDVTNITVQNKNPGFSVSNNAYIQAVFVNGTYRLIRT